MPITPFASTPDAARTWVFGTSQPVLGEDAVRLLARVDGFLRGWRAHGAPVVGACDWRYDRFLLIAADEEATGVSGCSIDSLFRSLREVENEVGATVLDGSLVPFDGIVLGELAAKQLGRKVGDRVGVRLPDGKLRTLRVIAVVADGFGSVGLHVPYEVLAGHVGDRAATAVYARGDARAIDAVAERLGLQVTGGTVTRKVDDVTDSSKMNPLALVVILGVAVLYVAIALAATAATGTVARADELALLRLAGATRRDVVRLVAAEALAVTLVAGVLGCAITALIVTGLQRGAASLEGPVAIALPWPLLAMLIAAFAAISVTASALAARHTLRPVIGSPS